MRTFFILLTAVIGLVLPAADQSQAEMRPLLKKRAGIPPFEVAAEVINSNQSFLQQTKKQASLLPDTETPYLVWLTDSDTRIRTDMVMSDPAKPIYAARNMGNQLTPAIASIDYAMRHLHASFLLITGSTDSPAIRFCLDKGANPEPSITQAIKAIKAGIVIPQEDVNGSTQTRLRLAAEQNIDRQVELAMERYRDRVESGRLTIAGSIIDLDNQYGRGAGALLIINLNGVTDATQMRDMQVLTKIDPDLLKNVVGREPLPAPPQR